MIGHWRAVIVLGEVDEVGRRNRGRWWWGGSVRGEGLGFLWEGFGYLEMPPLIGVVLVQ